MKLAVAILAVGVIALTFNEVAGAKDYELASLRAHNKYRAKHRNTPSMTLDEDLNRRAQQCADYYISNNKFDHSCPYKDGAGENLYNRYGTNPISASQALEQAADSFYKEKADYNYRNPAFSTKTGHFTQMVWSSSTKLGAGYATDKSKNNKVVTVNLYKEPGNVKRTDRFQNNVQPPL